ncbi:hypothetical protein EV193_102489 [Herbihabitans rhizosphaerae]|uniref:Uncharacterized protein n=1 Tax=Herbihabitans rhizosphaerae TaxID=1872711 RepID=A0A4Q7L1W0_9PSEU|nr:hypothetical protein [Herbihabitans rhizosphaerae]RZS43509.1 hypothetical protein EV193_102489 [Herbihabitans rhizosphaerae]
MTSAADSTTGASSRSVSWSRVGAVPVPTHERQGAYPSPTVVIDGRDVVTGAPPATDACCRLDLPTHEQIHTALTASW